MVAIADVILSDLQLSGIARGGSYLNQVGVYPRSGQTTNGLSLLAPPLAFRLKTSGSITGCWLGYF